jgi:tRNA-dihydrouridine synthase B
MQDKVMTVVRIGSLRLDGNLILAPMAGYTDMAFRVLCRRAGAALVCSEMVHASAIAHENPKTRALMRVLEEERPVCIQLFGTEPEQVAASCKDIAPLCDAVSFNFGCPAFQIKASGCGAVLLDHPDTVEAIVAALRKALDNDAKGKPLIPKMRLGNKTRADYVGIAKRMEKAGADAIIVHGRTASQGYSGKADWEAIGEIVNAVSIPVIANGDIIDGKTAKECLRDSGAAGLAIGRAALGDPDVFRRINAYLEDGTVIAAPSGDERIAMFKEYLTLAKDAGIDRVHIIQQAMQFTKGIKGGARIRERLSVMKDVDDAIALLVR